MTDCSILKLPSFLLLRVMLMAILVSMMRISEVEAEIPSNMNINYDVDNATKRFVAHYCPSQRKDVSSVLNVLKADSLNDPGKSVCDLALFYKKYLCLRVLLKQWQDFNNDESAIFVFDTQSSMIHDYECRNQKIWYQYELEEKAKNKKRKKEEKLITGMNSEVPVLYCPEVLLATDMGNKLITSTPFYIAPGDSQDSAFFLIAIKKDLEKDRVRQTSESEAAKVLTLPKITSKDPDELLVWSYGTNLGYTKLFALSEPDRDPYRTNVNNAMQKRLTEWNAMVQPVQGTRHESSDDFDKAKQPKSAGGFS